MSELARGMEEKEREKVLHFVSSLMGATREYFEAAWRLAPGALPEHSRIYVVEGRTVSHMHLFFRRMSLGPARITVGQIGDVCTDPAYRHRGYGTALLEDSAEYFRRHGAPFSMIISGVFGFYHHGGYQSFPLRRYVVDLEKAPEHTELRSGKYYIRRAMREEDLHSLATCYMEYNRRRPLSIVRDLGYWKKQFWTSRRETEDGFLVAEKDGRVVAYSRMGPGAFLEAACLPEAADALPALFGASLQLARKRRLDKITVYMPEDEPFTGRLKEYGEEEEYLTTLVKVVDLPGLLESVASGLNHVLEKPVLEGLDGWKVGFHVGGKAGILICRSDGIEGVEGIPKGVEDVVDLDDAGMVEMLAGRNVPGEGEVRERLVKLFNGKAPYFWPMDTV